MARRAIWLCADDYGMAPGVSRAIRDLIGKRRLNATSAMTVAPHLTPSECDALSAVASDTGAAIGLHVTLTAPFAPLTATFRPLAAATNPPTAAANPPTATFLTLGQMLSRAVQRRLDNAALTAEVDAQFVRFYEHFGRPPDFVDGHQHVHLFPQVRDAVLTATRHHAPAAWARQCGRFRPLRRLRSDPKAILLDVLSLGFRSRANRLGIATNPAFAGTYNFTPDADFAALFPQFLQELPDGGLIMCHPGFVDAELIRLDPVTGLREREHAFLDGDAFAALLAEHAVALR